MMSLLALVLVAGMTGAPLSAAGNETFEPGTGKYILVLKKLPSEKVDPVTGKKKSNEPDVVKHGGKVLHTKELVRIVKLPHGAAKHLRKEENVAYIQRVWVGESREAWKTDEEESSLRAEPDLESLADLTWTTGQYAYDGSGNIKQIGSDTYRYDTAGRLVQAVVKGTSESYAYDSFGNLVSRTTGSVTVATPANPSNNRLTSETYDAAGNATMRGGTPAYTFDSVSMMDTHTKAGSTHRMIYGPDDERIGVVQEGTQGRWKVRGFDGKVLREYRSEEDSGIEHTWVWMKDYVYAEGRVIGTERMEVFGGKRHFHTDHLGTVRMITDQQKYRVSVHEYFPFGIEKTDATQEYNNTYDPTNPGGSSGDFAVDAMKFTGHERDFRGWLNVDNDDYLDYMHARYYDPNMGRFLSVDPVISKASMRRPQMWNRYSYVANNPINATDPTGKLLQVHANPCSAGQSDCYTRLDAYQALKDMLPTGAGKYMSMDKNGFVSLKGISQAAFAKQFGGTAGRLGELMSTRRGAAHLSLSSESMVDKAGGAGVNVDGPNAIVKVDPVATRGFLGGVLQSSSTALAHELGHAYQHIFGLKPEGPGVGYIDPMAKLLGVRGAEAFGMWAENQYRQEMGLDIRTYYKFEWGDYTP